jgi:phage gp46-like protein
MAAQSFFGRGLLLPFQRDQKNDFANSDEVVLLRSHALQILGTRCDSERGRGELPWRTDFGSKLYLLAQQRNVSVLQELARVYVIESLGKWMPEARVKSVTAVRFKDDRGRETGLQVKVGFDVQGFTSQTSPFGQVQVGVVV